MRRFPNGSLPPFKDLNVQFNHFSKFLGSGGSSVGK